MQVPYRLLQPFHKIHVKLVRELEKKLSSKDVVIVANRRIMPKPKTGFATARPRSRTLTAVGGLGQAFFAGSRIDAFSRTVVQSVRTVALLACLLASWVALLLALCYCSP